MCRVWQPGARCYLAGARNGHNWIIQEFESKRYNSVAMPWWPTSITVALLTSATNPAYWQRHVHLSCGSPDALEQAG